MSGRSYQIFTLDEPRWGGEKRKTSGGVVLNKDEEGNEERINTPPSQAH